jgi:hypothetical protein
MKFLMHAPKNSFSEGKYKFDNFFDLDNKGITKSQAQRNCDVISFQSDMGTDQSTNGPMD